MHISLINLLQMRELSNIGCYVAQTDRGLKSEVFLPPPRPLLCSSHFWQDPPVVFNCSQSEHLNNFQVRLDFFNSNCTFSCPLEVSRPPKHQQLNSFSLLTHQFGLLFPFTWDVLIQSTAFHVLCTFQAFGLWENTGLLKASVQNSLQNTCMLTCRRT